MTDSTTALLRPTRLGALDLANRLVMAPLTRTRTGAERRPGPLTVEYYRQRATAGLVVSEGVAITPEAVGYLDTPGLWRDDQVEGWRAVTDAVHAEGGRVVAQLWHVGRISHHSFHDGGAPVSSTDRAAQGRSWTAAGFEPTSPPRALATDELPRVAGDYRRAAWAAREAGFDGVEVHGANGYLLEQFLTDGVNDRTDAYGGDVDGRTRFAAEVVDAVVDGFGGADRVGIRLSVGNGSGGAVDSDPAGLLVHLGGLLQARDLAYVHYVEPVTDGARHTDLTDALRSTWQGPLVLANGFTPRTGAQAVAAGRGDAVAFGRLYIANPDLVARVRDGAPLAEPDSSTFYGTGPAGYTDYPTWEQQRRAA